ncbi:centromere protein L-like [Vespa velutina]|uniref:centromere protein L-like n=1 Tax=Vespa velutina TaxID=202808 RepID=UPI001FB1D99B|nr:centromere protein L-like [Vespa velutina]
MESSSTLPGASRVTLQTPYRTPRLKFSLEQQLLTSNEESDTKTLKEIISLTWNIYGVSALFGFQYNDKTILKLYGKRLREEIATNLSQENVAYDAHLSIIENTISDTMRLPLLKVEVYAKKLDQENNVEKCIYIGFFLSLKTNNDLKAGNSVKLPLLLCRGTRTCMNVVHSTFNRMFDCLIIALPIEQDDLMWLLPIIILPTSEEKYPNDTEEVRLEYLVPGLSTTNTITAKFSTLDLIKILNAIMESQNNETQIVMNLTIEHIQRFRECLQVQMKKIAGLELGLCTLHRISLPRGTLMDNKMKIMDPEIMKRVLLYMTEKSLDMLHALFL